MQKSTSFGTSDALPHSLACFHLAGLTYTRPSRLICRREARKLWLIEGRSWRVKTGRQRRRFCTAAGKGPLLPTFRCRLIPERQAEQFLWRASRFCAMEEIYRPRSNWGFPTLSGIRSFAPSLRSLIKPMKSLWKTQKSRSLHTNFVIIPSHSTVFQKLCSAYLRETALCITLTLSSSVSPPPCFIFTKQTR